MCPARNSLPAIILFLVIVLMEFRKTLKRDPSRNFEEVDTKTLMNLRDSILKKFNVDGELLPEEYLQ